MTGTITKRGKGAYLLRLFLGRDPETGKQLRPTKTVHGTRKEADRALREWIDQYESGRLPGSSQKATLGQYLNEWMSVAKNGEYRLFGLRLSVKTKTVCLFQKRAGR